MRKEISIVLALAVCLIILHMGICLGGSARGTEEGLVASDQTVTGFVPDLVKSEVRMIRISR